MKPLHWWPRARRDTDAAAQWYALQGGLPLELEFVAALEAAADLISRYPGSGSIRHAAYMPELPGPLRFHRIRRFDRYLIYYLEQPSHVDVIRVWDASRGLEALMQDVDRRAERDE